MFKWGTRKTTDDVEGGVATAPADPTVTSKVLPRVLAALAARPAPVLLDLGPVVGSNVAFFGEQLACKIHVADLYTAVEAHARRADADSEAPPLGLAARLSYPDASLDGILCWDLFDFLEKDAAHALAGRLAALLRPGGVVYGFFGTAAGDIGNYTRFVVESDDTMRHRPYPATPTRRNVLTNRDITRMFDGLEVVESVLLKSQTRETLFRKPS